MEDAIVFLDAHAQGNTWIKTLSAVVEINEVGQAVSAELLWLRDRIGDRDSAKLLAALRSRKISYHYSEEVDALTFSFGTGIASSGQQSCVAELIFEGEELVGLKLVAKRMEG